MIKEPDRNCALCPRLKNFRDQNRLKFPDKFNAPVPFWGPQDAELLIVGLAPGLKGANFTSRPFTGDYAGDLLYSTLVKFGFAKGEYKARPDDGLELINCRITNAVKCVPPENKPTGDEIKTCQKFLESEIANMPQLKCILSLGKISHDAVLRTCGHKLAAFKFAHNAKHKIRNDLYLIDSYHCSRYNTQTGRLTEAMFHDVFDTVINLP
jgi:uracil-DNA glycosylase family 4